MHSYFGCLFIRKLEIGNNLKRKAIDFNFIGMDF